MNWYDLADELERNLLKICECLNSSYRDSKINIIKLSGIEKCMKENVGFREEDGGKIIIGDIEIYYPRSEYSLKTKM